ncbi:DUF2802 domain-containing protein [Hydrogenophilus thiooxidans]|uniref:DUF2802 domain-containing protein n=1 Tax=Hydrogenophilus thiooxidans TaxID=2820326 RepID=UPI001C24545B|nr:DUF2802 domain-containing protein [Hydrogenophilus thiooxidans]
MTAFVMVVMAVSLAWLILEGWRWWRAGQALAAHAGKPFAAHLELRAWQQEIQQLRVVLATQQQQIAALQAELEAIKGGAPPAAAHSDAVAPSEALLEPNTQTASAPQRAVADVSPEYAEPLALARRGAEPEELVKRCGVSLAEAQLIWALANGPGGNREWA